MPINTSPTADSEQSTDPNYSDMSPVPQDGLATDRRRSAARAEWQADRDSNPK
ncbi:MAG: hypothetical protein AAF065_04735 [Verrucomicrobiota bacterium]